MKSFINFTIFFFFPSLFSHAPSGFVWREFIFKSVGLREDRNLFIIWSMLMSTPQCRRKQNGLEVGKRPRNSLMLLNGLLLLLVPLQLWFHSKVNFIIRWIWIVRLMEETFRLCQRSCFQQLFSVHLWSHLSTDIISFLFKFHPQFIIRFRKIENTKQQLKVYPLEIRSPTKMYL